MNRKGILGIGALLAVVILFSGMAMGWGGNLIKTNGIYVDQSHFNQYAGDDFTQNFYIYGGNGSISADDFIDQGGDGYISVYAEDTTGNYLVSWDYTISKINATDFTVTFSIPEKADTLNYNVYVWGTDSDRIVGYAASVEDGYPGCVFTVTVLEEETQDLTIWFILHIVFWVLLFVALIWRNRKPGKLDTSDFGRWTLGVVSVAGIVSTGYIVLKGFGLLSVFGL